MKTTKSILGGKVEIIGPHADLIANHIESQIAGGKLGISAKASQVKPLAPQLDDADVIIYTREQQTADEIETRRQFKAKHGREMNYEDALQTFSQFTGQSQDTGRRGNSGSADEGIKEATKI